MSLGLAYRSARALLRPVIRLAARPVWTGFDNLPTEGGVVVVANHLSALDPFAVGDAIDAHGRPPRFLAKAEIFEVPVFGPWFRRAGQIPVQRRTASAAHAYDAAVAAVRRGECVVLYPEGTLTHDPDLWPMRGRSGAARIALASGAPVIPLAHWGVQRILPPRDRRRFRPFRRPVVRVLVGPPVVLDDLAGAAVTAELLAEVTERIVDAITDLLEQLRGEPSPRTRLDGVTMVRVPRTDRSADRDERWGER